MTTREGFPFARIILASSVYCQKCGHATGTVPSTVPFGTGTVRYAVRSTRACIRMVLIEKQWRRVLYRISFFHFHRYSNKCPFDRPISDTSQLTIIIKEKRASYRQRHQSKTTCTGTAMNHSRTVEYSPTVYI